MLARSSAARARSRRNRFRTPGGEFVVAVRVWGVVGAQRAEQVMEQLLEGRDRIGRVPSIAAPALSKRSSDGIDDVQ
jgi:hypothetical protein